MLPSSLQSLANLTKTIQQESFQSHLISGKKTKKENEPFSWLGLIQEGVTLLNLTTAFDAALGQTPLISVPWPRSPTEDYYCTRYSPLPEPSEHSIHFLLPFAIPVTQFWYNRSISKKLVPW